MAKQSKLKSISVNIEKSAHVLAPQQKRSREALANIVNTAEQLLRKKGIEGFSITEVATISKIPVGSIYRRFEGKAELLQAIKEDVMIRIENVVIEHISDKKLSDIETLVRVFAEASTRALAADEEINRVLLGWTPNKFSTPTQSGAEEHMRVFTRYRDSLVPLLATKNKSQAEMLARVSFNIVATAITGKVKGGDPILDALSWTDIGAEFGSAAIAYLEANVGHRKA
jgi:AcrR family transcriptional regulator